MSRTRYRYGRHPSQIAELWREGRGNLPVVVLVHGGFFRARYGKRLMVPLARALSSRGWAVWNIEYRRSQLGGGFPATFVDVRRAIDYLDRVEGLDFNTVVVCGHSAGATLALWAAAADRSPRGARARREVAVTAAVSLGGVVDLVGAAQLNLGGGAVSEFLGGAPQQIPLVYQAASPFARLPIRVLQVLIHGVADDTVPAQQSASYAARAEELGDFAVYLPLEGIGHLEMIEPSGVAFEVLIDRLDRLRRLRGWVPVLS